jgi:N-acetylglucosaminyldiphosphoundecaprenol N-acetyl-beta-D-mannosaminyltransferase
MVNCLRGAKMHGAKTSLKSPAKSLLIKKDKTKESAEAQIVKQVKILNVSIDNVSKEDLLKKIGSQGGVVFTPNVDHLMKLQNDPEFHQVYQSSTYRVCDSKILMYASKFLGQPLQEKISGSDLFPDFYQYYSQSEDIKIFLLGAGEGVAKKAQETINQKVGREMIVDCYSPPFGFEKDAEECERIIRKINASGATVLAVGLGAPKQEIWIAKYKVFLKNIKIFLAIGATIDFEAGEKSRSPKWMSELGLEWLYRLQTEPNRLWKRYLVEDLPFFWLLLKQKLNLYEAPFANNLQPAPELFADRLPVGELLQQAGLLSELQIQQVLEEQASGKNLRFGEILASRGWLRQETIDFFVEGLPLISISTQRQPLGYYLKQARLLDDAQINTILAEQQQLNLPFGEIAVNKGWLKPETIDSVLNYLISSTAAVPMAV